MIIKSIARIGALSLMLTGAALAQNNSGGGGNNSNSEGLVNVSLGDVVLQQIANDLNVEVSDLADLNGAIQVPVGVAANVCNVSAAVLAQQAADADPCVAQNSSQALSQAVQKQMKGGNK